MKRKEMLLTIIDELAEHLNGKRLSLAATSKLLAKIEEKMLPPFNKHMCYMDGDNANQESISYCVWDD